MFTSLLQVKTSVKTSIFDKSNMLEMLITIIF